MKCLCCGKELPTTATPQEKEWQWHKKCVHAFFGTTILPEIDLSEDALNKLVNQTINKGLAVPGVQKKMSLHLTTGKDARLTLVNYPTGYILKPQTDEYAFLPEYEHLAMQIASLAGVRTVPHALIKMNQTFAYITRRIDRKIGKDGAQLYAMEDFCQLAGRLTEDKYKGSYESCGKIIRQYSSYEGFDLSELFLRIIVSFIIGNSDMHLKNFSLIEESPSSRIFRLSEAYDFLPVNIILPSDHEEMALTVNGKKKNIHRKDFISLASHCSLPDSAAVKIIDQTLSREDQFLHSCEDSFLPDEQIKQVQMLIKTRCEILKK